MSENPRIDHRTVEHLCTLARLNLSVDEVERVQRDLAGLLDFFAQLHGLGTAGLTLTIHGVELPSKWRSDDVAGSWSVDTALANAPETHDGCFKVPKFVG
jgi:aspartyl-tRNA(Asn)/glutamyl-tRNA(Gln) amidotransferase subunit C